MGLKPLIEARGLSFSFGNRKVLDSINFEAKKGEAVFLLGPNGSGKTTLLKLLLGFYRSLRGEVLIKGRLLQKTSRKDVARTISYVPQLHRIAFGYRVLDVVLMGRTPHKSFLAPYSKRDHDLALECLERLSILHLKDKPYSRISGGERKLTLIARALAQQADMLVLDEPADGLDFGNQVRLLEHIAKVCLDGITCIITTHLIDHVSWVGTRAVLLKDGRIIADGSPIGAMNEKNLNTLYGVDVTRCTLMNGMSFYMPKKIRVASRPSVSERRG
jgi:iron complex transport system ATP-binding protein